MTDKRRHQTNTERDIEGIAARRERGGVPSSVQREETPPPVEMPSPIDMIDGFDRIDPSMQRALTMMSRSVNEAIAGVSSVWHLRHDTERVAALDAMMHSVSRESAQSGALLTEFVMPAIKQLTAKINALSDAANVDSTTLKRVMSDDLPEVRRFIEQLHERAGDLARAYDALELLYKSEKDASAQRDRTRVAEDVNLKTEDDKLSARVRTLEEDSIRLKTKLAMLGAAGGALIGVIEHLLGKLF